MNYNRRQAGFTLVEVLIATVILCTIIPLTSYFVNSMKTNSKTKLQQTANFVAQKYMEEYKAMSIESYTNLDKDVFDTESGLSVHVNVVTEKVDPYVGQVNVCGDFGSKVEITLKSSKGSSKYTGAKDGDSFILKVREKGADEELCLEKPNGTQLKTIKLNKKALISPSADRVIFLSIKDDPEITLTVKNELPDSRWSVLVINEESSSPHFVLKKDGKTSTMNTGVTAEIGARITITVKDADNNELAKVTQVRKM